GTAKKYYEKAIEKNPNYDKAYFFLANIYDIWDDRENAIYNYKKSIDINPNELWAMLIYHVFMKRKKNMKKHWNI
ncbi:Conserved protein, tetratricopeptide repeat family protein, partial [human gut metagenome]